VIEIDLEKDSDPKDSKKIMIARALIRLPNQKGTKSQILSQVEMIYNLEMKKKSSLYNSLQ
jgi:hypothetical protein